MPACPRCSLAVPDALAVCPSCGAGVSVAAPDATALEPAAAAAPAASAVAPSRPASVPGARFAPGEVLAGRYRIVGPIGRGGMGEVYRADDLKLGQTVALKFLPREIENDVAFLERFHGEVRTARQIAHPNVCRVYDIVEAGGRHFLTMEYVDGEDLASLLRRIGQLPEGKALEVARQLCAGLAAIHECGVVHRDLKPANVMLDGHGRVRITDFGLALEAGGGAAAHEVAGTPAYMAPEQFDGRPPTTRTDLYALGLIMYEVYTGKRAFEAASFAQWRDRHTSTVPKAPSQLDDDVDAVVERAILRCLEKDPARRPPSAKALAASLPGGDPLAAALAAGETPSPEMVAAAGGEGALSPRAAWSLLAAAIALGLACVLAGAHSGDLALSTRGKSPAVLLDRARTIVDALGYEGSAADSARWLGRDYLPLRHLARQGPSTSWRPRMREWGPPYALRYRESPRALVPSNPAALVLADDPPKTVSGMVSLVVDSRGRLRGFEAVPPQVVTEADAAAPARWDALFEQADLDLGAFTESVSRWLPPQPFDERREWSGVLPWAPDVEVRVAAAAYRGKPVYFAVLGPWSVPERMVEDVPGNRGRLAQAMGAAIVIVVVAFAVVFARRNLRAGRGDRRGAIVLAAAGFALGMIVWLLQAHHQPSLVVEIDVFFAGCAIALVQAAVLLLVYLALEPFVRRTIPELLISWARVAEGRLRDPRVGRDVLAGGAAGALSAAALHLASTLAVWLPVSGQTPIAPAYRFLLGVRSAGLGVASMAQSALMDALLLLAVLFVLRLVTRRTWAAGALLGAVMLLLSGWGENPAIDAIGAAGLAVTVALVAARFGLVALFAQFLTLSLLTAAPLPLVADAWYASYTVLFLAAAAALVGWGFRASLGARVAEG